MGLHGGPPGRPRGAYGRLVVDAIAIPIRWRRHALIAVLEGALSVMVNRATYCDGAYFALPR